MFYIYFPSYAITSQYGVIFFWSNHKLNIPCLLSDDENSKIKFGSLAGILTNLNTDKEVNHVTFWIPL